MAEKVQLEQVVDVYLFGDNVRQDTGNPPFKGVVKDIYPDDTLKLLVTTLAPEPEIYKHVPLITVPGTAPSTSPYCVLEGFDPAVRDEDGNEIIPQVPEPNFDHGHNFLEPSAEEQKELDKQAAEAQKVEAAAQKPVTK